MINSELMTLRDTADHYGVMIDDIKRWVNDKKLNVAKTRILGYYLSGQLNGRV